MNLHFSEALEHAQKSQSRHPLRDQSSINRFLNSTIDSFRLLRLSKGQSILCICFFQADRTEQIVYTVFVLQLLFHNIIDLRCFVSKMFCNVNVCTLESFSETFQNIGRCKNVAILFSLYILPFGKCISKIACKSFLFSRLEHFTKFSLFLE